MKIDVAERIEFYLGDCASIEACQPVFKSDYFLNDLDNTYYNFNKQIDRGDALRIYILPLQKLVSFCGFKNKIICVMPGDIHECYGEYALSKTRGVNDSVRTYSLLKCFEYNRHWKKTNELDTISFDDKKNKAVWRGASNGFSEIEDNGYVTKERRGNRFRIVEKYLDSDLADVGLSKINKNNLLFRYESSIKEEMTSTQMRQYKYIISLEGNDKDSGLNWKLKSNSVVLMCRPIINSWLMEEKLQPNKHYVEIADDLSDLEEKINWCNNNTRECRDIIRNANEYMAQFDDTDTESFIESEVLKTFLEKVKITEN